MARKVAPPSRSRSAAFRQPFLGRALQSRIPAGRVRFPGLWNPRSKLTARRSGKALRAASTIGTAQSTSLPFHTTSWCGMKPCRSSSAQTGTPSSTGHPTLPFGIQRVCGPDMENTFSLCGMVSATQQAAVHLVDLALRAQQEVPDPRDGEGWRAVHGQRGQAGPGAPDGRAAGREVSLHPLRAGAAGRPDPVEERLQVPRQVPPLPPAGDAVVRGSAARGPDQAAHRVPEQTDVRRVMDVGLGDEWVTAPVQGRARLFSPRPHGRSRRSGG